MKFITNYKEFGGDDNRSVLDFLREGSPDGKAEILKYLRSGKDDGVRCSGIFDYVKNEPQLDTVHLFTDGEYFWDSEEIYHYERYNVDLDIDFVRKVRS